MIVSWPRFILLVLISVALIACASTANIDAERDKLLKTDQQWSAGASQGTDIDAVVSFWTDDATVFPDQGPVVRGKAAIRAHVAQSLKIPGFRISWTPLTAVIARGGDLGYTTGVNSVSMQGPDGKLMTFAGRYVTVWRKQADGQWKCVIDIWNSGPPPQ